MRITHIRWSCYRGQDLVYQTQIQRVVAGAVALWVTRLFLGREIQNLTPTGSVSCILGQDTLLSQ